MDDKEITKGLNKILTLEHGHLGMYESYSTYEDIKIRRAFRRFMEIEMEHINTLKNIIRNMGEKPSLIIESGDILGRLLGISIKVVKYPEVMKVYGLIEKKSSQGYLEFISTLEQDGDKNNQLIAEMLVPNMLEAQLMQLWLENNEAENQLI